jgi:hypothetical protein
MMRRRIKFQIQRKPTEIMARRRFQPRTRRTMAQPTRQRGGGYLEPIRSALSFLDACSGRRIISEKLFGGTLHGFMTRKKTSILRQT